MKQLRRTISHFGGMNTRKDPNALWGADGYAQAQKVSGFHVGKSGRLDSNYVGTAALSVTHLGHAISGKYWTCNNGWNYRLYCTIDSSGVMRVEYSAVNSAGTAAARTTLMDATQFSNDSATNQWYGSFAEWNSGTMYFGCAKYGVWRIEPNPAVATHGLKITLTDIPASSFLAVANNRLFLLPGDEAFLRWSVQGDPERWIPTADEANATPPVYDVDFGIAFQSLGVSGSVRGLYADEFRKVVWTDTETFCMFGTGNIGETSREKIGNGYGMAGFNSWVADHGSVYFASNHDGGRALGLSFGGGVPNGAKVVESIPVSKNFSVAVFDALPDIQDQLLFPASDCRLNSAVWDSRADFEGCYFADQFNTKTDPGAIYVEPSDALTISSITFSAPPDTIDASWGGTSGSYLYRTTTDTTNSAITNAHDGAPASTAQTAYTEQIPPSTGYHQSVNRYYWSPVISEANFGPYTSVGVIIIRDMDNNIIKYGGGKQNIDPASGVWQTVSFDSPPTLQKFKIDYQFILEYRVKNANGDYVIKRPTLMHTFIVDLGSIKRITKLELFDTARTLTGLTAGSTDISFTERLGEVKAYGGGAVAGGAVTLISDVRKIACSSMNEIGKLIAGWRGTGLRGTSGLQLYYRAGNTISTLGTGDPISAVTLNAAGTGYAVGNILTVVQSGATLGTVTVATITGGGGTGPVGSVTLTTGGNNYSVATGLATTGGSGTGCKINVTAISTTWVGPITDSEMIAGKSYSGAVTPSGTEIFVQWKAVFTLNAGGESPILRNIGFYNHVGNPLKSIVPMGHTDDKVFLSMRTAAADLWPVQEVVRDISGEPYLITNKFCTHYLSTPAGCYAFMSYVDALQYMGNFSYKRETNDVRAYIPQDYVGPVDDGANFHPEGMAVAIDSLSGSYPLLPFDGTNGSENFTPGPDMLNWVNGTANKATISTAQKKFGPSSLRIPTFSTYLSWIYATAPVGSRANDYLTLGTEKFTFDTWFRLDTDPYSTLDIIFFDIYTSGWNDEIYFGMNGGDIQFIVTIAGIETVHYEWKDINPDPAVWHHVELIRSGESLYCFVNGVRAAATITTPIEGKDISASGELTVEINSYRGAYVDEWRLLKGVVANENDFDVPTVPYTEDGAGLLTASIQHENGEKTVFSVDTTLDDIVLPKSGRVPKIGRCSRINSHLTGLGDMKITKIEYTAGVE